MASATLEISFLLILDIGKLAEAVLESENGLSSKQIMNFTDKIMGSLTSWMTAIENEDT